jgi:iron complex outermembrane recepter protein
VSGKLSGRYDFTSAFALRGSVQNGFRAPSLQQQFFASTSTNFIDGVPFDITTFPATDPVAEALGSRQLDAEKSLNYSLGMVWQLGSVNVTVDGYRINIDDRVVLSENLTQTNVRDYLTSQGFIGIGGGRFFINGVDTETTGVDVVVGVPLATDRAGRFDFTVVGNYTKTEVTKVPQTQQLAALNPSPPLFDRVNVLTFEKGNPKTKFSTVANWKLANFGATLRATRYGTVLDPGTTANLDFELGPKTLVDLEGRLTLLDRFKIAVGAENLFDEYPDMYPTTRNTTGNTPFSNYAPFGRSGRFVYGRLSVSF